MKLALQGLNAETMSIEKIEITDLEIDENFSLKNFYFTFESIYLIKCLNNKLVPFIFETSSRNFLPLDNSNFNEVNYQFLSASSNTNFFWCLALNRADQNLEILQFSNKSLLNKVKVSNIVYRDINDLVILSTDVNTYVFENNSNGLKCLFELKSKKDLEKKILEQEIQLNENSISSLTLNEILIDQKIEQFSCGKEHILMLTEITKQVFSFGIGTKGQLGHGKIENCFQPKLISLFDHKIESLCDGSLGWHSGAIDTNGNCYLWGWNSHGQLGILNDDDDSVFVPKPTKLIIKDTITEKEVYFKKISIGARHSALVDLHKNLYTFGWNKYSQLFNEIEHNDHENEEENVYEPVKVIEFENKVVDVKCGCWLTLLLLKD